MNAVDTVARSRNKVFLKAMKDAMREFAKGLWPGFGFAKNYSKVRHHCSVSFTWPSPLPTQPTRVEYRQSCACVSVSVRVHVRVGVGVGVRVCVCDASGKYSGGVVVWWCAGECL